MSATMLYFSPHASLGFGGSRACLSSSQWPILSEDCLFYYEYQSNYICITWLCPLDHSCLDHSGLLTYALSTNFSLLKGKN